MLGRAEGVYKLFLNWLYRERINTLHTVYREHLSQDFPQNHAEALNSTSIPIENPYYYQCTRISALAKTYLEARSERWFGRGSSQDALSHFMREWQQFAVEKLPHYKCDKESIEILKMRINYLNAVIRHQNLFRFGRIKRKKNKFETMYAILGELNECRKRAEAEELRSCAGVKLKKCSQSLSAILLSGLGTYYYGRASKVHDEPLDLKTFLNPDHQVASTPTGQMLAEILSMTGPEPFCGSSLNEEKEHKRPVETALFNEDYSPKKVKWVNERFDLPPWIKNQQVYLGEMQKIGEAVLRLAKLKKMIDQACHLSDDLGNIWAYADQRAKLSLECLLFLLEQELQSFCDRYDALYQSQDAQRTLDNLRNQRNQTATENRNFALVDGLKNNIVEACVPLKQAIQDLRTRMDEFKESEIARIHVRKNNFYKEVESYASQYYPEVYERQFRPSLGLNRPLLEQRVIDQQESHSFFSRFFPEEDYCSWRRSYYDRNLLDYQNLASLLLKFENDLSELTPFSAAANTRYEVEWLEIWRLKARGTQFKIEQLLCCMKTSAENERPIWYFPFKRGLNQKFELLLQELDLLQSHVRTVGLQYKTGYLSSDGEASLRDDGQLRHRPSRKQDTLPTLAGHKSILYQDYSLNRQPSQDQAVSKQITYRPLH
ncbi:MAG TPA: hypothetical protein VLH77_07125 [Gammaproteobacteria bacterium]|nr:hypothetical protein [Gammaproteobacteria bacterium]